MQYYKKNTIDSLADLFFAWMGGEPDDYAELRKFIESTKLKWVLSVTDVDAIIREKAYFPDIAVPIIYNAIPLKFKTVFGEIEVGPEKFNQLNYQAQHREYGTYCLDLSFATLLELKKDIGDDKKELIRKEKNRKRMAAYRKANPEKEAEQNKRDYAKRGGANMTAERKETLREASRKYAKTHRKQISKKQKEKRLQMKLENPEAVKERDYAVNHAENRREIKRRYRERNREAIRQRARENPKEKEWRKKYKSKVRFRTKTGTKILALLKAIVASKTK